DLDGTLVDTLPDLVASTNAALRALSLPERSREEVAGYVGEGARHLVERAVSPREELAPRALEEFLAHYRENLLVGTRPSDGPAEPLAAPDLPLAVATNKPGRFARRILSGLGLLERFRAVLGSDEAPRKPDPAMLDRLRALVPARPEETILVGDSRVDV